MFLERGVSLDLFLDLFFVEFVHRPARVEAAVGELLLVGGLEDLEGAHQGLVHRHHRA